MKKIMQTESLADQAYRIIKESIIQGQLKDHEALPEVKLAEELGISRTPVRDALNRLMAEGLVEQNKRGSVTVASFTKEKSLEYIELRRVLETYNIEKIIANLDEAFFETLEENLSEQLKAIEQGVYTDFLEKDQEFHLLLASKNTNHELRQMIHRLNYGVNRAFILLSNTVMQSAEEAYHEHVDILDALKKKDVHAARQHMIHHIFNVEQRFLNYGGYEDDKGND